MKLTLFLSIIPTYSLSSLPLSSSSCGLYWGWPLQGWSAQDETPPHCPRNRYSPAHNDICALDGAVFANLLPKILDDACNKLLSNLWTGRCLPLVEGNSLVLQFLKWWKNVQCLFSPCNACCEMTSGKGTHLPERKILWAAIVAVLAHTIVASELADRVLIIITMVEYHYHQHRSVDQL